MTKCSKVISKRCTSHLSTRDSKRITVCISSLPFFGGDNNYSLIVEPVPDALSGPNSQGEYRALYTAEGPYDNILIRAQDGGGAGANYGAALLDGFGIDRTAPVIDVDKPNCPGCAFTYLDQSAVNLAETYSYPSLYFGEGILLERIFASDGAVGS